MIRNTPASFSNRRDARLAVLIKSPHPAILTVPIPMPKKPTPPVALIPIERIEQRIYLVRGHKVMLDNELAALYRVTTGNLNLAVRRNQSRFPEDFMFQLTKE